MSRTSSGVNHPTASVVPPTSGRRVPAHDCHPVDDAHGVQARAVGESVRTSESTSSSGPSVTVSPDLLLHLPAQRVGRALAVVHAAPGQEPAALQGDGGRGPGQQHAALGVAADAVGGDALASSLPGHGGHAARRPGRPPTPRGKYPGRGHRGPRRWPEEGRGAHGHRGRARGHPAAEVRLLPDARPQAVRRPRRAADRGRHRVLRGRQDRARGPRRPSWPGSARSWATAAW